jgi:hypothetical protein
VEDDNFSIPLSDLNLMHYSRIYYEERLDRAFMMKMD